MKPHGELLLLRVGGAFDPRREICDNAIDDTANGHIDCDDPDCHDSLICRDDEAKQLELFVMSGCPYGVAAENAMKEVLAAFQDDDIRFRVRYIIKREHNDSDLTSAHGAWELEEDIRQLCAASQAPKRALDYIWCRNKNVRDTDGWKRCATTARLDIDALTPCVSGEEGQTLAGAEAKLSASLKITASPTFLANNRFDFHALSPRAIQQAFCKRNPSLKGCIMKLSEKTSSDMGVCR